MMNESNQMQRLTQNQIIKTILKRAQTLGTDTYGNSLRRFHHYSAGNRHNVCSRQCIERRYI